MIRSDLGLNHHTEVHVCPHLVELDPELTAALQRGGEGIQVLPPEGKKLLNAQATQGVVARVANAVLLTHRHHLVVHMECVLGRAIGERLLASQMSMHTLDTATHTYSSMYTKYLVCEKQKKKKRGKTVCVCVFSPR